MSEATNENTLQIQSLITDQLGYCSSLYVGLPAGRLGACWTPLWISSQILPKSKALWWMRCTRSFGLTLFAMPCHNLSLWPLLRYLECTRSSLSQLYGVVHAHRKFWTHSNRPAGRISAMGAYTVTGWACKRRRREVAIAKGSKPLMTRGSGERHKLPQQGLTDTILKICMPNGVHFGLLLILYFVTIKSKKVYLNLLDSLYEKVSPY